MDFERSLALDMGQLLSIPLICFGLVLLWQARKDLKAGDDPQP